MANWSQYALHRYLKQVAVRGYGLRIDLNHNGWVNVSVIDKDGLAITDPKLAAALLGADQESNIIGAATVAAKKAVALARIKGVRV